MENRLSSYVVLLCSAALLAFWGCGGNDTSNLPPPPCQVKRPPPSGLEVLYGVNSTVHINYFVAAPIDPSTGALGALPADPIVLGSDGLVAVHARFLYASGISASILVPPGTIGISGLSLDQTTGAPTPLASGAPIALTSGASPRGLASPPNSYFLYVADSQGFGGGRIDAFIVDSATGLVTAIPGSPFASGSNTQLAADPSGKYLYASDDDPPGGVLAFAIGSNGALTPVPGSPFTIPGQTVANSQPYGIVDTGKFVYTALTAANSIAAFSIDGETGALTPVPGSPFPTATYPAVLALTSNFFLYTATGQPSGVSGFSIDPSSGVLTPLPGSPFAISNAATLAADPSGRYLYVGKFNAIQGYNIDACTGALTLGAGPYLGYNGPPWMTVVQFPASTAQ